MKELLGETMLYCIPMGLIIVELIAATLLLRGFLQLRRQKRNRQEQAEGVALYDRIVCRGVGEAHFLLRIEDMKPIYFTQNFEQMTGVAQAAVTDHFDALADVMGQGVYTAFRRAYAEWKRKEPLVYEYAVGGNREQWLRITVLSNETAEYDMFLFRDVTGEKHMQQQLEGELEKAKEESQSKTTFLSRMSHEIRTPINGMIGMLSLAHKQIEKGSAVDAYLNKAEDLSAHLVALVNDILDMSRIEAGKIELENKPFSMRALADKLYNMFQENIEAKGVRFEVEMLDFDADYFIGDEFRLSQVIVNFLSNAYKFTEQGEIRVTFREMLRENDTVDLMIRVHDTGIGMHADFVKRIFRPFEQESAETSKRYGGTGLGMAISDQIIRLMGGEIVIDSMPGQGSDFTVYLHLKAADEGQVPQEEMQEVKTDYAEDYSYEGKRILLAEDNAINAEIAVEILKNEGATVEVAENGQIAVDMVMHNPPGYYDFVLMDIQMPVLDGRDAARQIRRMPREDASQLLIFALSADAFLEDARLSEEAGMNGHFSKPVDFEEVRKQIGLIAGMQKGDRA